MNIGSFTVGVIVGNVIGAVVSGYFVRKKYCNIADKEVESVKKMFEERYNLHTPLAKNTNIAPNNNNIVKDISVPTNVNEEVKKYTNYAKQYKNNEGNEDKVGAPYIITPEEFQNSEYNVHTLYWYADGVLADDDFNIINDIKGHIGDEALNSFGLYEADCVYVRNDAYEMDYEILLDEREYSLASGKGVTTYPEDE